MLNTMQLGCITKAVLPKFFEIKIPKMQNLVALNISSYIQCTPENK